MRIAQVAPLYESVPPKLYGGTERVVSYLTEALIDLGHDVTLYASGDSITRARLNPQVERALRLDRSCTDSLPHHVVMAEEVFHDHEQFDIIHSHIDYIPYSLVRRCPTPAVTTLHGRLDLPDLVPLYDVFDDIPLVSISDAQRSPFPFVNWVSTVYHGLPPENFRFVDRPGDYLAFLGRISPEKRVDDAIEIATQAGIPLKIAAKVDDVDREYYEEKIKPMLDHPLVEYIGEIDEHEKADFLGNALALLFPIDWPEPFGLVMIESMACGTPVIARRRGSVSEVMEDGVSGFVFDTIPEAVDATLRVESLSRQACRSVFDRRFTARRMALDYVKTYERLMVSERIVGAVVGIDG